ncbi:MAG TPA: ATP-dependent DNA helicase RecG, partial [Chitinophagaceae bacterium]|nr:ATP-dependent DNA helicase RecG [Chitinophagaceae bacterium]
MKGVGPQRADLFKKELNIFTFKDLIEHFPFRHVDKSKVSLIADITQQTEWVQVGGKLLAVEVVGHKSAKRLIAVLKDK